MLAGSGASAVAAALGDAATERIVHRHEAPDIGALVALGRRAPSQADALRPLYLRPPDAKAQAGFAVARR
jgi:hypothetical protein